MDRPDNFGLINGAVILKGAGQVTIGSKSKEGQQQKKPA